MLLNLTENILFFLRQAFCELEYAGKCLANAKRPCSCSVLRLRPKSSLCSCLHGPHYGRIVVFTGEFYRLTERVVISMHVDATTG